MSNIGIWPDQPQPEFFSEQRVGKQVALVAMGEDLANLKLSIVGQYPASLGTLDPNTDYAVTRIPATNLDNFADNPNFNRFWNAETCARAMEDLGMPRAARPNVEVVTTAGSDWLDPEDTRWKTFVGEPYLPKPLRQPYVSSLIDEFTTTTPETETSSRAAMQAYGGLIALTSSGIVCQLSRAARMYNLRGTNRDNMPEGAIFIRAWRTDESINGPIGYRTDGPDDF